MNKSDQRNSNQKITKLDKTNNLTITMIKLLIPNLDKSFYLNIIVNESSNFKTKILDFKKTNVIEINQVFELDQNTQSIDSIKFSLSEKNSIFSNVIFKGEFNKDQKYTDELTSCNLCFLSNNDKQNCIVIYFRYELNVDLIENFDDNLKTLHESINGNKTKGSQTTYEHLKDIASGENAANFKRFVKNMEYLKKIKNEFINLIFWKDRWKTISVSLLFTIFLFYTKFFLCISPIFIIFFHVYNRKNLDDFSFKNKLTEKLENINFITKIIELTNHIIDLYENFIEAMQFCEKNIIEDIYINLIKLIFFNFIFFYFHIFTLKFFFKIFLIIFWILLLWNFPPFQAFCRFIFNFTLKKCFNINQTTLKLNIKNYFNLLNSEYLCHSQSNIISNFINRENIGNENIFNKYYRNTIKFLHFMYMKIFSAIPFARLILFTLTYDSSLNDNSLISVKDKKNKFDFNELFKNINQINDTIAKPVDLNTETNTDLNNKTKTLKFEIYENERWWMFVGWSKNLISNERPIWSDISGKNYVDFKSVFLPSADYVWIGNWTIEITENNDDSGWEYASDFNGLFTLTNSRKYVRRRKWIRYAKLIIE